MGFQLFFTFTLYPNVSILRVIVCKKQPTWPQLPWDDVFLTSTTCITRRDSLFECSHCLPHPGGRQIVTVFFHHGDFHACNTGLITIANSACAVNTASTGWKG